MTLGFLFCLWFCVCNLLILVETAVCGTPYPVTSGKAVIALMLVAFFMACISKFVDVDTKKGDKS